MLVAKYKLGVPRPPQALFRQGSMTQGRIYYRHLLHTTIPTHALRNSLLTPGRHTHSQENLLLFKKNLVNIQKNYKLLDFDLEWEIFGLYS